MTVSSPSGPTVTAAGFSRLVVAYDGLTTTSYALDLARGLVDRCGLPAEVVTVFSPGLSAGATRIEIESIDAVQRLGAAVITLASNDVVAAITAHVGAIASETDGSGRAGRPLLCLASHGRGRLTEMVMGSVSANLVRTLGRPILLAGPAARVISTLSETLLVSIDGSEPSALILGVAQDWVASFGGTVRLLYVKAPDDDARDARRYLGKARDWLEGQGVEATAEMGEARSPQAGILHAARGFGVAAVAMTTHGRGRIRRLERGSIALDVVRAAVRPVLLLNPHAEPPVG